MDLAELDLASKAAAGAEMDLLHPATGDPTGVKLLVLGYDSDAVREARRINRSQMTSTSGVDVEAVTTAMRVSQAKAAVIGITGGSGSTKTVEGFTSLLSKPGFIWAVDQIQDFGTDRANLFPKPQGD